MKSGVRGGPIDVTEQGQNVYDYSKTGKRTKHYPGMEGFLSHYVTPQTNNDAWGGWSGVYGNNPSNSNSLNPQPQNQSMGTSGVYGNNPMSTAPMPAAANPAGLTQPSIVPPAAAGVQNSMSNPFTPFKLRTPYNEGRPVPGPNGETFSHRIPISGFSGGFSGDQTQSPLTPPRNNNQVSSQSMLIRRGR